MTENQSCVPQTFAVREKLCLGAVEANDEDPYQSAVTELVDIIKCSTMLEKLDCLVRSSKEVMHCVELYYKERDQEAPSLGADDLLPVLCYIVVKSSLPQLVSECHAMEKLIHEGYMFGEEGYCLTSFQTAINYLISECIGNQEA
ncbi:VPS9 domain-containing protein 1-like [Ruditapes philippinarum]|uniref:VPS9 domain-containing protein 1-like n=1 Tax=Ruditapes philippinarum TaxID=129788 RepID=UPI00295BFC76|nr:VPS9 domain-containing protein 1-like [Ruditapes philippinarum]